MTSPASAAPSPDDPIPLRRVLAAGAAAALADAVFGIVYFVVVLDLITVEQFFQSIARGLLGAPAYDGGAATAALGAALHLAIGCIWAAIFQLALRLAPALRGWIRTPARAGVAGMAFGAVIWLAMDLVVLPLSAARAVPVLSGRFAIQLAAHVLLIGPPIALILRPHSRR